MKVFVKGKEFTKWKRVVFEPFDGVDNKLRVVSHYVKDGYDVKIEQIKRFEK